MGTRYMIPKKEQRHTLHVSPETHLAVHAFANKYKMTVVEATFILIRTGMRQWLLYNQKSGSDSDTKEAIEQEIGEIGDQKYLEAGLLMDDQELEQVE